MLVRLLFKQEAAQYIVNSKGLNSVDSMSCLNDERINLMCKSCQKPPVNDPPVQATCNAAAATWATREGHAIWCDLGKCPEEFKTVFCVKFKNMTSRDTNAEITLETLQPNGSPLLVWPIQALMTKAPKLTHKQIFEFID